jgi:hypothetical protein
MSFPFAFLPLPFHGDVNTLSYDRNGKINSIYPTIFEQPVVGKSEVVRIHFDRKSADIFDLYMQSLNLLLRKRFAPLFRVDSSVIQNFVWNVVV